MKGASGRGRGRRARGGRLAGGARVDRFLAGSLEVSRSEVQRWIEHGRVTVDGAARAASAKVREGERVLVRPEPRAPTAALPDESVRFDVLYVDDEIVIVNKPPGLVVHPARGHEDGTLVNGLLARGLFRREALEGDAEGGPGCDRRRPRASRHRAPARQGHERCDGRGAGRPGRARRSRRSSRRTQSSVRTRPSWSGGAETRTFSTLHGRHPRDRLRFTTRVAQGKRAVTHVRVLAPLRGATLVECTLETGRTHQIRVHLAENGTPVLGDSLYGKVAKDLEVRAVAERLGHQALHARLLGLVHPATGARLRFEAPPPADFAEALAALR